MVLRSRMMYSSFAGVTAGWHRHHTGWGYRMVDYLILSWPWLGFIAGLIVVISAIAIYFYPVHRRSLGITIVSFSLLNLLFGVGGMLSSLMGIIGGTIALSPEETSQD